ncbi:hypothetical protein M3J09_006147 [Ascochyta lentis]
MKAYREVVLTYKTAFHNQLNVDMFAAMSMSDVSLYLLWIQRRVICRCRGSQVTFCSSFQTGRNNVSRTSQTDANRNIDYGDRVRSSDLRSQGCNITIPTTRTDRLQGI